MKRYCKAFDYALTILVVLCLATCSEALAITIYVDWDANDGSSWANAYKLPSGYPDGLHGATGTDSVSNEWT
jgi:hypothetical protein